VGFLTDYDKLLSKINLANSISGEIGKIDDNDLNEFDNFNSQGYLTHFNISVISHTETISIPNDQTKCIVVRYSITNMQEFSTEFYIGIDLIFTITG
jgi:hypothetical protein